MKQVKEGWEVLASSISGCYLCLGLAASLSAAIGHDLHVWGTGEGQHRLMHFQSPLFLLFSPKCFSATVYIIYSLHMYYLSAISTAVGIEKKLTYSPPKCEIAVLWL